MGQATHRFKTSVSLDGELLQAAKQLRINVSRACERGLADEISVIRSERWIADNRGAIEDYNRYIEEHGLPLEKDRLF